MVVSRHSGTYTLYVSYTRHDFSSAKAKALLCILLMFPMDVLLELPLCFIALGEKPERS